MQRLKAFLGVLLTSLLVLTPAIALAQVGGGIQGVPVFGGLRGGNDPVAAIRAILNVLLIVVGIVAVIYLIYGGVQYLTSAGDQARADSAKKTILYALIGLVVIGLSIVVVNFVLTAIGSPAV